MAKRTYANTRAKDLEKEIKSFYNVDYSNENILDEGIFKEISNAAVIDCLKNVLYVGKLRRM